MDPTERLGPTNADMVPLGFDQDMKGISDLTCSMFDLLPASRAPNFNELEYLQKTNDWLQLQNKGAKETVDEARNQIRGQRILSRVLGWCIDYISSCRTIQNRDTTEISRDETSFRSLRR